jgi:hydrogenase-4 component B
MVAHAAGAVALGLVPGLGLAVVERPARLFVDLLPGGGVGAQALAPAALLAPAAWIGLLLVGVLAALFLVRRGLAGGAPAPVHVTWGCGYTAPTPRLQYTGASYSSQFAGIFEAVLVHLRRERLPRGPFPEGGAHLGTHCVDAVEQRMFEVMGEGDGLVKRLGRRIPIDPRFSLAAGLVVLVTIVGLVVTGSGVVR